MNYEEAVAIFMAETKREHDERCFEVGNCDLENETDVALVNARREYEERKARILLARETINRHLEAYDAAQIVPARPADER